VEQELRVAADDRNSRVRCAACETLRQLQVRIALAQAAVK
jgi:hypothetical protein